MREIKFRAWDIKEKCMLNMEQMGYVTLYDIHLNDIENTHEWEIMQFTGLKDKTGKEIYEGDIVTYSCDGTNKKLWKDKIIMKDGCLLMEFEDCPPKEDEVIFDIRVIGNIYQNPELIKK